MGGSPHPSLWEHRKGCKRSRVADWKTWGGGWRRPSVGVCPCTCQWRRPLDEERGDKEGKEEEGEERRGHAWRRR
jgi:hypothetical protein